MQRPDEPDQNVTQPNSYTLTQVCKMIRGETLKLFYFTNKLVLNMADFEDHVSPIFIPPRAGTEKLRVWRDLVGPVAVRSADHVDINLQYHYLGTGFKLELLDKAGAILRETFSQSTTLKFSITIHLPIPEGLKDEHGLQLTGLKVVWIIGESPEKWATQVTDVAKAFWVSWCHNFPVPQAEDRIKAIITVAFQALLAAIDSMSAFWTPVFGPALPPAMDAEREETARVAREKVWQEKREESRRAVQGDD